MHHLSLFLFNQVQYQMNLKQYSWRHLPVLLQEAFLDHQEVYYPLPPYLHRCVLPTTPIAKQVFFPTPPPPPLCIPTAVYEHSRNINMTTSEKKLQLFIGINQPPYICLHTCKCIVTTPSHTCIGKYYPPLPYLKS